jgi:hypothetical protein
VEARRVVFDVAGASVPAATPTAVDLTAAPVGDGPFTYSVVSGPGAGRGTATATATGVEITPAAGVSGVLTASYRVTGQDGIGSTVATATLDVAPVALAGTVGAASGTTATVDFPTPLGSGPFTYAIVAGLPAGQGTATVTPGGRLAVAVPGSSSGTTSLTYTVTDGDGLTSSAASLTVSIAPRAFDDTIPSLTASSRAAPSGVARDLPAPQGTGPFTWSIVAEPNPALGSAAIDPVTGRLRVSPKGGASGTLVLRYRVTDASGLDSAPATVTLAIAPATDDPGAPTVTASTTGNDPVRVTPRPPVGTGPFHYRLVSVPPASEGTVTIDPDTGVMTFVPAPGFTGHATFRYEVVDANGLVSSPQDVTVEVMPETAQRRAGRLVLALTGLDLDRGSLAGACLLIAGTTLRVVERRRRRA